MSAYISVSCANIYRKPSFHSETDTQVVLGEKIQILNRENDFLQIRCEDGYQGWLNRFQLSESSALQDLPVQMITSDYVQLFAEPKQNSAALRDGVAGSYIFPVAKQDQWFQVLLPDGMKAWIEDKHFSTLPALSRDNLITYARRFMGIPYLWAGKTTKGFDCSGFTQFVYKMFGASLRRDAWMQFEDGRFVSDDPAKGQAGDLMFFAESGDKITHVGFCLGTGEILHARGMVRINSLVKGDALYNETLVNDFVEIRSFL